MPKGVVIHEIRGIGDAYLSLAPYLGMPHYGVLSVNLV
jgi:hypothetical protein